MKSTQFRKQTRGMMMLEVLIALLIFTIGVLGMVKMQAVSTANSFNSEDRATAALLAEDLISELWAAKSAAQPADFGPVGTSGTWLWRVNQALRNGDGSGTTFSGNTVTIVITWNRQLGRNVEAGTSASTDPEKLATYTTQVIIQ